MAAMPGSPSDLFRLANLADQCVMCGLCLPFCPTYAVGREEGESPRGRIALIKALAEGRTSATPTLVDHLDSCLACRRCEAVCPANVQYGELIAGARALPAVSRRRPSWRRMLDRSLSQPRRLRALQALRPLLAPMQPLVRGKGEWAKRIRLLYALAITPAQAGSRIDVRGRSVQDRSGVLAGLPAEASVDVEPMSASGVHSATDTTTAESSGRTVILFQGCVAHPYEVRLRDGAMRLLTALGERVEMTGEGLCCGSLARFGGDAVEADARETELVQALGARPGAVVLGSATGCQARLADAVRRGGVLADELQSFLADHAQLSSLRFAPFQARVAVHRPCSQRALGPRSAAAVDQLLALIPALVRVDLPEQERCCGAAGSHFIARPTQSLALRERVLGDVAAVAPDLVVSANIGCRLMIAGGLDTAARRIPVLHPVELLAQQLLP